MELRFKKLMVIILELKTMLVESPEIDLDHKDNLVRIVFFLSIDETLTQRQVFEFIETIYLDSHYYIINIDEVRIFFDLI